jgi:hypothetical protein
MRRFISLAFALSLLFAGRPAPAGPPFVTDDPEPVEPGHFEINTALQGTYTRDGRAGAWPTIDSNYGAAEGVQLHLGLYASFAGGGGETEALRYGYGDTEIGVKLRFIDEDDDGWRPQVAVYPITQFPTGDAGRGLGAGHQRTILPVWAQKSWGDWTSYGGAGYWLNRGGGTDDRDFWFFGWVLQRKISEDWTLGGELFRQTAQTVGGKASSGFNLGGYYNFDETDHLIFTVGRGVRNTEINDFSYYAGYQLQF